MKVVHVVEYRRAETMLSPVTIKKICHGGELEKVSSKYQLDPPKGPRACPDVFAEAI